MASQEFQLQESLPLTSVFGFHDRYQRQVSDMLGVRIWARDHVIFIDGQSDAVQNAMDFFRIMQDRVLLRGDLTDEDVQCMISQIQEDTPRQAVGKSEAFETFNGRRFRAKTAGQAAYVQTIRKNEIVFCVGPAGTGKTYLAVAAAVAAMKAGTIKKIVLVRPAVEAGESLGFLPGDLKAKIDPYLRPLFDALRDMMDPQMVRRMTEDEIIEMIPLAYMRGRTLNDAFIILDEAQNTTASQMKMFLTRLGNHSRMIISGDITQIDLPRNATSGLVDAIHRLENIQNIAVVRMTDTDVVRHDLVQKIVRAYEE